MYLELRMNLRSRRSARSASIGLDMGSPRCRPGPALAHLVRDWLGNAGRHQGWSLSISSFQYTLSTARKHSTELQGRSESQESKRKTCRQPCYYECPGESVQPFIDILQSPSIQEKVTIRPLWNGEPSAHFSLVTSSVPLPPF